MTATVQAARRPYRCVDVALAVHGDVQPRLGALDGNDPEPHRNQVELHCNNKKRESYCSCSEILSPPPLQPPPVLCSISVKGEDEMCLENRRGRGRRGLTGKENSGGGMELACLYSRGHGRSGGGKNNKKTAATGWRISLREREREGGGDMEKGSAQTVNCKVS